MDKTVLVVIGVLVVGVASIAAYFETSVTGNAVAQVDLQKAEQTAKIIEIGLNRNGYTDITVEVNKPVILKNDGSLGGCGLYPVQPELGLAADFSNTDTYEFTPTKKGSFTYTCSMGMFKGTINVV